MMCYLQLDPLEQCARFLTLARTVRSTTTGRIDACPRLAPNLLEVGVEKALMKCLTLVRDAHRALFQRVYLQPIC
jgi:hypothetical protein